MKPVRLAVTMRAAEPRLACTTSCRCEERNTTLHHDASHETKAAREDPCRLVCSIKCLPNMVRSELFCYANMESANHNFPIGYGTLVGLMLETKDTSQGRQRTKS
eukprot:307469-Amphidinium_carterae.1